MEHVPQLFYADERRSLWSKYLCHRANLIFCFHAKKIYRLKEETIHAFYTDVLDNKFSKCKADCLLLLCSVILLSGNHESVLEQMH